MLHDYLKCFRSNEKLLKWVLKIHEMHCKRALIFEFYFLMVSLIWSCSTYVLIVFQQLSNIFCVHRDMRKTEKYIVCPRRAYKWAGLTATEYLKCKKDQNKGLAQIPKKVCCQSLCIRSVKPLQLRQKTEINANTDFTSCLLSLNSETTSGTTEN